MTMTLEMDGGGDGWRRVWSNGQTFFSLSAFFPPPRPAPPGIRGLRWLNIRINDDSSFVETYVMSSVITSCNRLMRVVVGLSMGMQDARERKLQIRESCGFGTTNFRAYPLWDKRDFSAKDGARDNPSNDTDPRESL